MYRNQDIKLLARVAVTLGISVCALCTGAAGQKTGTRLIARVSPGESVRYRLEGTVQYIADVDKEFAAQYKSNVASESCQFWISSVATITPQFADAAGNTPVTVTFSDSKIENWVCPAGKRSGTEDELRGLGATKIKFQIGPHGEVSAEAITAAEPNHIRLLATDLLAKLTADVLETRLADAPVMAGAVWKPHGQFLSQNNGPLRDLELGGTMTTWKETTVVGGHECALLKTHYVFTPSVTPASPTTPNGVVRQRAVNAIAGEISVSLLFDLRQQLIGWLSLREEADNQVRIAGADSMGRSNPGATIKLKYEGTATLVPQQDALEWLVAIKAFEERPQAAETAHAEDRIGGSLAAVASEWRALPKKNGLSVGADLEGTPAGFTRWSRSLCANSQFCAQVSLALPGEVRVEEESESQTAYLASTGEERVNLTVGPVLSRDHAGLTPEEELAKHTKFFLTNLWMADKPVASGASQPTTVDGYSALITAFRARRKDLVPVEGKLVILLSPWGDAYPVTCSWDGGHTNTGSVCDEVIGLIRLKR